MWSHHRMGESIGPWEVLLFVLVIVILFGHHLPSIMRNIARRGPWD